MPPRGLWESRHWSTLHGCGLRVVHKLVMVAGESRGFGDLGVSLDGSRSWRGWRRKLLYYGWLLEGVRSGGGDGDLRGSKSKNERRQKSSS